MLKSKMAAVESKHCVICGTSAPGDAPYHRITQRTASLDQPSLGERISKVLRIDDVYSAYRDKFYTGPLCTCSTCIASVRHIEAAAKLKKKLKRSFREGLAQTRGRTSPSGEQGTAEDGSGPRLNKARKSKKKKSRNKKYKISVDDLQLCIREIDEIITHVLQDELIHRNRSQTETQDGPELLSTELTIVKEMFCELDKELETGKTESASTTPDSVMQELSELVKKRIKMDYRDRLIQHMKRMVAYIAKHSCKFDSKGDGLQKFCDVLQRDSADEMDSVDTLSVSSTQSSVSSCSISLNLRRSVDDIFQQTASQIAQAWLESSSSLDVTKDQSSSPREQRAETDTDKTNDERTEEMTAGGETDIVIGAHMQQIINGEEETGDVDVEGEMEEEEVEVEGEVEEEEEEEELEVEEEKKQEEVEEEEEGLEVIDIESVDSDEVPVNAPESIAEGIADSSKEPETLIKPKEEELSDQDGQHNMIIDDDTEQSDDQDIKQESDIQEIEPEKKEVVDVPLICIDSDDDDDGDGTSDKDGAPQDGTTDANEPGVVSAMLSYEEIRWQHQQQYGTGRQDCSKDSSPVAMPNSRPSGPPRGQPTSTHHNNSAQAERLPAQGATPSFSGTSMGNRTGIGQYRDAPQGHQKAKKSFDGWRPTEIWPSRNDQPKPTLGRWKHNKFRFKNKKFPNQQLNQQGRAIGNKQMFKHKLFQLNKQRNANKGAHNDAPVAGGVQRLHDGIRSPPGASRLDIIPVISSSSQKKPVAVAAHGSDVEQRSQVTPGMNPAPSTGLAKPHKSKNRKFIRRKQQLNKKQHYNNFESDQVVARQHGQQGNHSNRFVWTSDRIASRPNIPNLMSLSVGPGPQQDKPGFQSAKQGAQSAQTSSVQPGPQSASPGPALVKSGPQSAKPGFLSAKSRHQSAILGSQSAKPNPKLGNPGPRSVKAGLQSAKAGPKAGTLGPPSIKSGPQSVKSGPQSAKPSAIKSGPQSAKSGSKSGTLGSGPPSVKPGPQSAKPSHNSSTPAPQSSKSGPKSGTPGPQSAKPNPQSTKHRLQAAKSGPAKSSQPSVMQVLGSSSSQTLHVKAKF